MRKLDISEQLLLRYDGADNVRIGNTAYTLEAFVRVHNEGKTTPADVRTSFPELNLEEVYFLLGWVTRNRAAIAAYLAERRHMAAKLLRERGVEPPKVGHLDRHKKALGYAL